MSLVNSHSLNVNPKTPAQLRANFARLQQLVSSNTSTLDDPQEFDSATPKGAPVYVSSAGHVALANAGALATSHVVGLAADTVSAGGTGQVVTSGYLTNADWTDIIGSVTLSAGTRYYLSTTSGDLTSTAPTTTGQVVVFVGIAISAQTLLVQIDDGVLL